MHVHVYQQFDLRERRTVAVAPTRLDAERKARQLQDRQGGVYRIHECRQARCPALGRLAPVREAVAV